MNPSRFISFQRPQYECCGRLPVINHHLSHALRMTLTTHVPGIVVSAVLWLLQQQLFLVQVGAYVCYMNLITIMPWLGPFVFIKHQALNNDLQNEAQRYVVTNLNCYIEFAASSVRYCGWRRMLMCHSLLYLYTDSHQPGIL